MKISNGTHSSHALVALGSNLGDRRATISRAIGEIAAAVGPCLARSPLIETDACIHPDDDADWHPPFLNGAALFKTELRPLDVLQRLFRIESTLGRERSAPSKVWQPRTIDLDLLALDNVIMDTSVLVLPHPRMHERRFVLEPLAKVAPDWRHPILKLSVRELLNDLAQ